MPSDDIPLKMLVLLLELLKSGELPELAVGGAWCCVLELLNRGSVVLGPVALELDISGSPWLIYVPWGLRPTGW